ncbi:F174B protein, partial [Campylorhamphus procurvoides]|nr:F174B protein [Campylorhamphus procurvoides]
GRMRPAAAPSPLPLLAASVLLPLVLLVLVPAAPAAPGILEPPAGNGNGSGIGSRPPAAPGPGNHSGARLSPVPAALRDLSALKAAVIGACALTAALIACLLLRVFRSGKRIKKTRKYDIITTPAERVEMAPLNEEDDEDEDSTVFDVKYR